MSENDDTQRLKDACVVLIEHFDSVQIFCTRHEPEEEGGTIHAAWGAGNWFARFGQISEWMVKQDETTRKGVE